MTDDQGWGDVGYHGHPVLRTPHLDQMASEGIQFHRFYSASSVCSPTRGSCLTGRHPSRYGIPHANTGHIKKKEVTLAEVMKSQGYRTGHFGKWHLGTLTKKMKDSNRGGPGNIRHYAPPWDHGFEVCFSTEAKVPTYWEEGSYEKYGTHYWTGENEMVPTEKIQGDDSKLIMDQALPFIAEAATAKQPFFSVIWFHTPHLPVVSAPPYTDGYTEHRDYYGCLTAMDEQMGRLRATLEKHGVAENTMIWFCSDNGPEGNANAPGRTGGLKGRKRSLYEGGVRVPGLLLWPEKISVPRVVKMPACTSDYFPTVLSVLGYRLPDEVAYPSDGIDLVPLIDGRMTERPQPIGFEFRKQISLTGNRFKLYSKDGGESYELYDLIADQNETTNLAANKRKIVQAMSAKLRAWRDSCRKSAAGDDYR